MAKRNGADNLYRTTIQMSPEAFQKVRDAVGWLQLNSEEKILMREVFEIGMLSYVRRKAMDYGFPSGKFPGNVPPKLGRPPFPK